MTYRAESSVNWFRISQIWAIWLANIKTNFAITQLKCLNLGNYFFFIRNQLTDDSALCHHNTDLSLKMAMSAKLTIYELWMFYDSQKCLLPKFKNGRGWVFKKMADWSGDSLLFLCTFSHLFLKKDVWNCVLTWVNRTRYLFKIQISE